MYLIVTLTLKNRNIKSGICIVGEPTNMKIVDTHKGCYEYSTHFTGLAGHGSAPDKGVNAVEYATKFINKLMEPRSKIWTAKYTSSFKTLKNKLSSGI